MLDHIIQFYNQTYQGTGVIEDAERHELQRQIDIHQCQNLAEVATSKKGIQKFKKINDRKDPFYKYGYAVQAYFCLIRKLIRVLIFINLFAIFMIYHNYNHPNLSLDSSFIYKTTIGNINQPEYKCFLMPQDLDLDIYPQCEGGTIKELTYVGGYGLNAE